MYINLQLNLLNFIRSVKFNDEGYTRVLLDFDSFFILDAG